MIEGGEHIALDLIAGSILLEMFMARWMLCETVGYLFSK